MSAWEIVDDGDREFTGPYDVWIEEPDEDGGGGKIIGACWAEYAPLFRSSREILSALIALESTVTNIRGIDMDAYCSSELQEARRVIEAAGSKQ